MRTFCSPTLLILTAFMVLWKVLTTLNSNWMVSSSLLSIATCFHKYAYPPCLCTPPGVRRTSRRKSGSTPRCTCWPSPPPCTWTSTRPTSNTCCLSSSLHPSPPASVSSSSTIISMFIDTESASTDASQHISVDEDCSAKLLPGRDFQ